MAWGHVSPTLPRTKALHAAIMPAQMGCPRCGDSHDECNSECLDGGCECPNCGHYDVTPQPWGRKRKAADRVTEVAPQNPVVAAVADHRQLAIVMVDFAKRCCECGNTIPKHHSAWGYGLRPNQGMRFQHVNCADYAREAATHGTATGAEAEVEQDAVASHVLFSSRQWDPPATVLSHVENTATQTEPMEQADRRNETELNREGN